MADPRLTVAKTLLTAHGWAALATSRDTIPFASMVAYVCAPEFAALLMVVSDLAVHTPIMRQNPHVALVVSDPERPGVDSQNLARVTVSGEVRFVAESESVYHTWREHYLARFPEAQQLFQLRDFHLVALLPASLRIVAGFGQIMSAPAAALVELWDQ